MTGRSRRALAEAHRAMTTAAMEYGGYTRFRRFGRLDDDITDGLKALGDRIEQLEHEGETPCAGS